MNPLLANTAGLAFPPIFNASSLTVAEAARTQPNVSSAMRDWFRTVTVIRITDEQQQGQIVEKTTPSFQSAVIQPYRGRILQIMKEGQRSWKWSTAHFNADVDLPINSIVIDKGKPYRIMTEKDFTDFGYVKYHVIRDYDYQPTLGT